jgi:hypothetical protein
MVGREILRDHGYAIPRVGHGDIRGLRLGYEKRAKVSPLIGNAASERIIDEHGQIESFSALEVRDLHSFLTLIELDIILG